MKKTHLVIIDPQNDFMDSTGAALPVTGANADMDRIAAFIARFGEKISDIHISLDSHQEIDIAHPVWWQDTHGNSVPPFTIIKANQIENGEYTTRNPEQLERSLNYVKQLEKGGMLNLFIWPTHCKIGTWGHAVQDNLMKAVYNWQTKYYRMVNYVYKGTNPYTEHYGAIKAEVHDPEDPTTQINEQLLSKLRTADTILITGEALSHCVMQTVNQIVDHIGAEHVSKIKILTDTTSPVGKTEGNPDFPAMAKQWLGNIQTRGVTLLTTETAFSI